MSRPSTISQTSQTRRREPAFPALQTRGSSTSATSAATATGAWGTTASPLADTISSSVAARKKGPSLSFAVSPEGRAGEAAIHPLKYTWDVWFSHRSANMGKGGKKDEAKTGKEKESREEWEGAVVKLGGFSSVESMHPFLSHLTPPSSLPASVASTISLFGQATIDSLPASTNVTDYNIFRAPIAPAWEDPMNAGGGRWVLRLRKGVADRVWEEIVWALVGERIGLDDDKADSKVNGVVLSVRRDEDILSLWVAPSNRTERDVIRDSLRTALEPLLSPTALANLQLDYKPHPVSGGIVHNGTPRHERHRTESPHRHDHRRDRSERADAASSTPLADGTSPTTTTREGGGRPRLGDRGASRTGTGFSSYVSRLGGEPQQKTGEAGALGSIGSGASFGRPRRASVSKEGGAEGRGSSATSWGRS